MISANSLTVSDPAQRFIDAAVRPLGDNAELEVAARKVLGEIVSTADGDSLYAAAERLEETGVRRRWPVWKITLYAITLLVSLFSLEVGRRGLLIGRKLSGVISPMTMGVAENPNELLSRQIAADKRLLLFGDTSKYLKWEQMKALWDAEPDNPAYFAEYAMYYRIGHDSLPPDFLETAARLDPDNAWFTLMAASTVGKDATEKLKLTAKERKNGVLPSYRILDEARYREALALIAKAASQSRFDSYQAKLMSIRIALLPERTDFVSQLLPIAYLVGLPADTIQFRHLVDVVDAECAALAAAGNENDLRSLAADWESCLTSWSKADGGSMVDAFVLRAVVYAHGRRMAEMGKQLGMTRELERWEPVAERIKREKEARDRRTSDSLPKMKGGILAGLSLPVVANQTENAPKITEEDLKPGRLVDHELFSRVFSAFVWQAFGLMAAAAAFYRTRESVLVRRLSQTFEGLFRPVDWLWVFGGGIILPFAYYQVVYRLTPFGARDWSVTASGFVVPSLQFGAASIMMIVMPVLIARWRLAGRAGLLGLRKSGVWREWAGVICGALAIPAIGVSLLKGRPARDYVTDGNVVFVAQLLFSMLFAVWVVIGVRAAFGRRSQLLRRLTITRVLVPAYVSGMLLMVGSMPVYHAAEKHWMAQDRLMEISPQTPGWTRYEYEVTQVMRQELREILEP